MPIPSISPLPPISWPLRWDWPISLDVGPPQSVGSSEIRFGSDVIFTSAVTGGAEPRWWTVTSTGDDRQLEVVDGRAATQFFTDNAAGAVAIGWRHPYYRPSTGDPSTWGSYVGDYKSRVGWWEWDSILGGAGLDPVTVDHGCGLFVDRQDTFVGSDPWPGGADPSCLVLIGWDNAPRWTYRAFDPAGATLETVQLYASINSGQWTTLGLVVVSSAPGRAAELQIRAGGDVLFTREFGSSVLARMEDFSDAQGLVWGCGMGTGSSPGAGARTHHLNAVRFRAGPQLPDGTPILT